MNYATKLRQEDFIRSFDVECINSQLSGYPGKLKCFDGLQASTKATFLLKLDTPGSYFKYILFLDKLIGSHGNLSLVR